MDNVRSVSCSSHGLSYAVRVWPPLNRRTKECRGGGCPDLIDLIKDLTPVVVSISIERHMLQQSSTSPPPLFRSRPGQFEENGKARDKLQADCLGSGFFCDTAGHIVTNAHVVEGAARIIATLSTGKVVPAKVVAVHPKVDLALIKIVPPFPVHKAKLGDSSEVQVGEWVLAVGNPFGLGRTVTVGIVSGKGRFIGLGPDDNFIQTDASINPGNSGGPLFNMAGEVVGVNTAIIASGKGIGFSIPSNYIKELLKGTPGRGTSLQGVARHLCGRREPRPGTCFRAEQPAGHHRR